MPFPCDHAANTAEQSHPWRRKQGVCHDHSCALAGRGLPAARRPTPTGASNVGLAHAQSVDRRARSPLVLPPVHALGRSSGERAGGDGRGRGRLGQGQRGPPLPRRRRRPVVRQHRLWPARGGRGDLPAGAEAALLSFVRRHGQRAVDPGRRPHRQAGTRGHEPGVLRQFRVGRQRHQRQARLALQHSARQAKEAQDHLAPARLSRRHGGLPAA